MRASLGGLLGVVSVAVTFGCGRLGYQAHSASDGSVLADGGDLDALTRSDGGRTPDASATVDASESDAATADGGAGPLHFFVLTNGSWNGNLGGSDGATQKCLDDLNANDWLGRPDAPLTTDQVMPLLVTSVFAFGALPSTTYAFARSGDATVGGATFTTDASGLGPGDRESWSGPTRFGIAARAWTGVATSTDETLWGPDDGIDCDNFGIATGTGITGVTDSTGWTRWHELGGTDCATSQRLYCFVSVP